MKRIFAAVLVLACLLDAVSAGEADSQAQYERAVENGISEEYIKVESIEENPVKSGFSTKLHNFILDLFDKISIINSWRILATDNT